MKQAAFIQFCKDQIGWDLVRAHKHGLNKELALKARGMRFRQGLCNSNQDTGIFTDQYQRCAFIKDPQNSLLYIVVKTLSNKFTKDDEYLIPICDYELAAQMLKSNNSLVTIDFTCTLGTLPIDGKNVIHIRARLKSKKPNDAPSSALSDLLKFIANWGLLATQDTLIQILLDLDSSSLSKQGEQCLAIVNDNFNIGIIDIIKLLDGISLNTHLEDKDAKCYAFYCNFLQRFIQGFNHTLEAHKGTISLEEMLLCMQSLRRLYFKLLIVQDQTSNYQTFMTSIEFAFDEVVNLLSIIKPYSKDDLFYSIRSLSCHTLQLSDELPTAVSMAGSCMQNIHRKITSSLRYLDARGASEEAKVLFTCDMYYEVCKALELEQDFEDHKLVTYRGLKPQSVQSYAGQIVDLMLLHFHANVNRRKSGFRAHDVASIIENQFKLRADQNSSKQLIVILDGTMTDLTGDHMRKLLASFRDRIHAGQLAVIMVTSLNKYLQIGFDRFPSGISTDFYAKEHFPGLAVDELVGFEERDAIPQTVAHFLRHVGYSLSSYYRMVHDFSRHLHDNIIPKSLYSAHQPIKIDDPYTKDNYKNPWGFMVIRFADEDITAKYKPELQAVLRSIGIEYRDGFGFNSSRYSSIGANLEILRISIGPNSSEKEYKEIVRFIELLNHNICRDSNRSRMKAHL